ncbi:hypothetical protein BDQ12DRAFT_670323 [Crucibulum laeve]|uniref:Uncharacterized protein n=1 Tax=Crucibulum laeve TaxID=68775 RepID=A0A5C3LJX6_9AGAR|nr:hypothetical protein BDQ12DRAFT_670323 [Crucibulum laeve]
MYTISYAMVRRTKKFRLSLRSWEPGLLRFPIILDRVLHQALDSGARIVDFALTAVVSLAGVVWVEERSLASAKGADDVEDLLSDIQHPLRSSLLIHIHAVRSPLVQSVDYFHR